MELYVRTADLAERLKTARDLDARIRTRFQGHARLKLRQRLGEPAFRKGRRSLIEVNDSSPRLDR